MAVKLLRAKTNGESAEEGQVAPMFVAPPEKRRFPAGMTKKKA
jgi:hypothetical protein